MDSAQFHLSRRLISCGTIMVVAALLLVGFQGWLSAADVRDHRTVASAMLQGTGVARVTLADWEPPSNAIPWTGIVGGFALIGIGIRIASKPSLTTKGVRVDLLD